MNTKTLTRTALSIAVLVVVQFLTKSLGQIVTGSCVNLVLALSAFLLGYPALFVALISPFIAFLLGIGPKMIQVVPAIAVGNMVYVILIVLLTKALSDKLKQFSSYAAVVLSAFCKFACLYLLIVKFIGPTFLADKVQALAASFGIMQFVTALIGGLVACVVYPLVKKGIKD